MLNREDQLIYLCSRAESDHLPTEGLSELLPASEREVSLSELDSRYDLWLDQAIRTNAFPQYANIAERAEETSRPIGADYQALQRMVGLGNVKSVLEQVLSYRKMQDYAQRLNMPMENNSMHMVFTGNPGTAKTTVARLFAGILKDNGILSGGELIEVGRSEIVDRYVGGTAPRVKELFRRAKGNVLFIDEAYSLVSASLTLTRQRIWTPLW